MTYVRLRAATVQDALQVWEWRCDPQSLAASLNAAPIPYADHLAWFSRALNDPDRRLFVITAEGADVGVLRLDRLAAGEHRVSINLAPAQRAKGLGRAALQTLVETEAQGLALVAEIRRVNLASRRIFEACGFTLRSETDDVMVMQRLRR